MRLRVSWASSTTVPVAVAGAVALDADKHILQVSSICLVGSHDYSTCHGRGYKPEVWVHMLMSRTPMRQARRALIRPQTGTRLPIGRGLLGQRSNRNLLLRRFLFDP